MKYSAYLKSKQKNWVNLILCLLDQTDRVKLLCLLYLECPCLIYACTFEDIVLTRLTIPNLVGTMPIISHHMR